MRVRLVMMAALMTFGAMSVPAHAGVNVSIEIGVRPPPLRVEAAPPPHHGYIWSPGYWAWDGRHHVWVEGHWVHQRAGYRWVPERWEERGRHDYRFEPARWEKQSRYGDRDHHDRDQGRGHDHHEKGYERHDDHGGHH